MYVYACIEMKNVHNVTFSWLLHGTIATSGIDENIYNVMRQLAESNFFVCFCDFSAGSPLVLTKSCPEPVTCRSAHVHFRP